MIAPVKNAIAMGNNGMIVNAKATDAIATNQCFDSGNNDGI